MPPHPPRLRFALSFPAPSRSLWFSGSDALFEIRFFFLQKDFCNSGFFSSPPRGHSIRTVPPPPAVLGLLAGRKGRIEAKRVLKREVNFPCCIKITFREVEEGEGSEHAWNGFL